MTVEQRTFNVRAEDIGLLNAIADARHHGVDEATIRTWAHALVDELVPPRPEPDHRLPAVGMMAPNYSEAHHREATR
jgi:hypothetical protein